MTPVITPLIEIQQQLKIFHWQTKSYTEHIAFEKTYDSLQTLVDTYVECLFGRVDRIYASEQFTITLENYSNENINQFVDRSIFYLQHKLPVDINDEPSLDLANIRDEMVQAFTKLKYLLTLK